MNSNEVVRVTCCPDHAPIGVRRYGDDAIKVCQVCGAKGYHVKWFDLTTTNDYFRAEDFNCYPLKNS